MFKKKKQDKLPPHCEEAEQGVLGCILLNPRIALPVCVDQIHDPDIFYLHANRILYELFLEMYAARAPIDTITIQQELRRRNQLDSIGGLAYLSSLPDAVPSAANIDYYLKILADHYILRKLDRFCADTSMKIDLFDGDLGKLVDCSEREIMQISTDRSRVGALDVGEMVSQSLELMDQVTTDKSKIPGIPTGFTEFDEMTCGLIPKHLKIIAARPSIGKTSFAMNMAENQAINLGYPVGFISLEMTAEELVYRMLCSRAEVDSHRVRHGLTDVGEMRRLAHAADEIKAVKDRLRIESERGVTLSTLNSKLRRMVVDYGIRVAYIDYLQLIRISHRRDNRSTELGEITGGLKDTAGELGIPIVLLSQLNRDQEKDKNRQPRMSDLRESGSIEQDADLIGLLWKPGKDADESGADDYWRVQLLIAKQRNGPVGKIDLNFYKKITRFKTPPKIDEVDHPLLPGVKIKEGWYIPPPGQEQNTVDPVTVTP